jgi:hypothetical protein
MRDRWKKYGKFVPGILISSDGWLKCLYGKDVVRHVEQCDDYEQELGANVQIEPDGPATADPCWVGALVTAIEVTVPRHPLCAVQQVHAVRR